MNKNKCKIFLAAFELGSVAPPCLLSNALTIGHASTHNPLVLMLVLRYALRENKRKHKTE